MCTLKIIKGGGKPVQRVSLVFDAVESYITKQLKLDYYVINTMIPTEPFYKEALAQKELIGIELEKRGQGLKCSQRKK